MSDPHEPNVPPAARPGAVTTEGGTGRHADNRFDELLDAIPDIIVSVTPEGRVLACSPAVKTLLDYAPEELIGLGLRDLPPLDAEGQAIIVTQLGKVLRGERTGAVSIPFRHRDGSRRWLEARSAVLRDASGATTVRAILRDTTERLMAEQRLRAIVDSTNDIIIILDDAGTIVFENPAVERILGFGPGERIGHSIFEYAHPDDRPLAAERFAALATPDATTALTLRFRHKNGTWRHLETYGRNMRHVEAIGGVLGVARDITERTRLQERLEAAERLDSIGRLAGGIAHDFNNLLAVILGSAEELRHRGPSGPPGDAERDVRFIVDAAERARELTTKLLTFARRQIAEPGGVDVPASLRAAESFLRRLMGEACTLTIKTGDRPWRVPVPPAQFEQVLLNLAANARDAMPEGGRFTIEASVVDGAGPRASGLQIAGAGDVVRLAFSDTGVGIPHAVVDRVFEPFYTTKEHGKGTGLGLSMVYGIVRGAGGDVRIASEEGAGTTAEVFLPLLSEAVPVRPSPEPATPRGGRETVLLVEDNDDVRRLTMRTLSQVGYRVLEAAGGQQAIDLLATGQPVDLVVTDVVMPQMNGVTVAQEVRKMQPRMPVLFITGYTPEHVLSRQTLDDRTALLTKPFKRDAFLRHVRQMLDTAVA